MRGTFVTSSTNQSPGGCRDSTSFDPRRSGVRAVQPIPAPIKTETRAVGINILKLTSDEIKDGSDWPIRVTLSVRIPEDAESAIPAEAAAPAVEEVGTAPV
jgi:hypothetical protein